MFIDGLLEFPLLRLFVLPNPAVHFTLVRIDRLSIIIVERVQIDKLQLRSRPSGCRTQRMILVAQLDQQQRPGDIDHVLQVLDGQDLMEDRVRVVRVQVPDGERLRPEVGRLQANQTVAMEQNGIFVVSIEIVRVNDQIGEKGEQRPQSVRDKVNEQEEMIVVNRVRRVIEKRVKNGG